MSVEVAKVFEVHPHVFYIPEGELQGLVVEFEKGGRPLSYDKVALL